MQSYRVLHEPLIRKPKQNGENNSYEEENAAVAVDV